MEHCRATVTTTALSALSVNSLAVSAVADRMWLGETAKPARLASLVFQIVSLVIALLYAHQQVCKIVVTGVISSNKRFQFKFQFNFASWKRLIFIIHFKILIILTFYAF